MSEPTKSLEVLQPLPVKIVETEQYAPEFGSLSSYTFDNSLSTAPVQVLPRAPKRSRAILRNITGSAGFFTLGTIGQVSNGQGFFLNTGLSLEITAQSAVWAVCSSTAVLSVLDERYR
jgi:hypothetical protein